MQRGRAGSGTRSRWRSKAWIMPGQPKSALAVLAGDTQSGGPDGGSKTVQVGAGGAPDDREGGDDRVVRIPDSGRHGDRAECQFLV